MRLIVEGPIPAKKNRWHRSKNGGMYFDSKSPIQAQIEAITWTLKNQWRLPALVNPMLRIKFECLDQRADLDNKLSTLLDCMVKAGVLKNDNLKHLSGPITYSGKVSKNEITIIDIG